MQKQEETIKKDCFAYTSSSKGCKALKKRYCEKGKCNFYKKEKTSPR